MRTLPTLLLVSLACGLASQACGSGEAAPASSSAPPEIARPAGEQGFDGKTTPACIAATGAARDLAPLVDDRGEVSVAIEGDACARTFRVASTAERRDDEPKRPRVVAESARRPSLQTGSPLFDALYQLALDEADACSVDAIRDGAFHSGKPLACPAGGCFETGREWSYVWTRDTAYATDLGLSWLDPTRARNSLELKLSTRRAGDDLQIVQDTGTGGSYPVSTDRAVWALGARRLLLHLTGGERAAMAARASEAIANTIEHDREVAFDATTGLYRGEQSFLDWREQSYPGWVVPDTIHVAMSKSLSTNVAHLSLLETGAELVEERGDHSRASRYRGWASELRTAIRVRFWMKDEQQLSTYLTTELDPAPARRVDLLGTSLAVLAGVLPDEEAAAALARYPVLPKGPPVFFPQQKETRIYHNRAIWPFVTAYWVRAARKVGNARAVELGIDSLVRGAALNLSNMENLELVTGKPWLDDGAHSGPVVNSQRQLWSVAGYIGMVHDVLFGLTPTRDGLEVAPFVTAQTRRALLGGADSIVLNNVPLRGKQISVVVRLPAARAGEEGAYRVARVRLNGITQPGGRIAESSLDTRNLVEVELAPPDAPPGSVKLVTNVADYRTIFAPRTPSVGVSGTTLAIDAAGEDAAAISIDVYRDGERVAAGLPGGTSTWTDPSLGAGASSHCYTVETRYLLSGNASQRARPACFWGVGNARISSVPASGFVVRGGQPTTAHGRFYHAGWGDPDDTIAATFVAKHAGAHLVEVVYANAAGPIDTGITCAVKRLDVEDVATGARVASGYVVMPHRGDALWGDSTYVRASLAAGKTYRVVLRHDGRSTNMSAFAHFASYTGGRGGAEGAFHRVDVAEVKVLSLGP